MSRSPATDLRQAVLFECHPIPPSVPGRLQDETGEHMLSVMRDKKEIGRLDVLVRRMRCARTPLERARLAVEMRTVADRLVGDSIREANHTGQTWRQIGADLGIPFQTLYRRFGTVDAE